MTSSLPSPVRLRLIALNPAAWLIAGSLALALIYGVWGEPLRDAGVPIDLVALLKASSIIVLATLAAIRRAPRLVMWALVFGAAGDSFLARGQLTPGALAFAFGHVCYIRAFLREGIGWSKLQRAPLRIVAMMALIAAAISMTLLLVPRDNALFAPLGVYTAVLTAMAMASFTLPASRWPTMLGAALFFISDSFVGAHQFHGDHPLVASFWFGFAGWMLYWAGQAGLCLGMLNLPAKR